MACLLAAVAATAAAAPCHTALGISATEYPRCVKPKEQEDFWVAWKLDGEQAVELVFGKLGEGWMGIGIGEERNGGMRGADIIAVFRENGVVVARDMFAVGYERPLEDALQHVDLVSAATDAGLFRAVVRRPLRSCDHEDFAIRRDYPHFLMFAHGETLDFAYHGTDARGGLTVNFFSEDVLAMHGGTPPPDPNAKTFSILYDNFHVPTADRPDGRGGFVEGSNQYKCFAVPLANVTNIMPPFDVLIQTPVVGSAFIHHFVNSQCADDPRPNPELPWGADPNNDIYDCAMGGGVGDCGSLGAWAAGGTTEVMPHGVGRRVIEEVKWVILDTHYYNPKMKTDARDSSGFEFTVTQSLRPHALGAFWLGIDLSMRLDPGQKEAMYGMHCPASQVEVALGDLDHITILSAGGHLHQRGKVIRMYIVRDGKRIPLYIQNYYDYNFQSRPPVKAQIKRGDALEVYCGFDTRSSTEHVRWGERTQDEMCIGVLSVYPAQHSFLRCMSYTAQSPLEHGRPVTWSFLNGVTDEAFSDHSPFGAMMSGCQTPPAACSAALWNTACVHVSYCFQEEICELAGCLPVDEHPRLKNLCAQTREMCRPCYTPGPGKCADCVDPCQFYFDNKALQNISSVHEQMHPAPKGNATEHNSHWFKLEHDLPWGDPWATDLSHTCAASCPGCDVSYGNGGNLAPTSGSTPVGGRSPPTGVEENDDGNKDKVVVAVVIVGTLLVVGMGGGLWLAKHASAVAEARRQAQSGERHTLKSPPTSPEVQSPQAVVFAKGDGRSSPLPSPLPKQDDVQVTDVSTTASQKTPICTAASPVTAAEIEEAVKQQGRRKSNIITGSATHGS